MTIRLYFEEDSMWQALVTALRARGIDVQTALDVESLSAKWFAWCYDDPLGT